MSDEPKFIDREDVPDLERRRTIVRIVMTTAGAASALYLAPVAVRIDEAEAGSKRGRGSGRRGRGSGRKFGFVRRRGSGSGRRAFAFVRRRGTSGRRFRRRRHGWW